MHIWYPRTIQRPATVYFTIAFFIIATKQDKQWNCLKLLPWIFLFVLISKPRSTFSTSSLMRLRQCRKPPLHQLLLQRGLLYHIQSNPNPTFIPITPALLSLHLFWTPGFGSGLEEGKFTGRHGKLRQSMGFGFSSGSSYENSKHCSRYAFSSFSIRCYEWTGC